MQKLIAGIILLLAICCTLLSCSSGNNQRETPIQSIQVDFPIENDVIVSPSMSQTPEPPEKQSVIIGDVKNAFYKMVDDKIIMISIGMSKEEVEGTLGKPSKEESQYVLQEESEWYYDNDAISIIYDDSVAKYIILKNVNEWFVWGDIKPGVSLSEVENIFGQQLNMYDGTAIYWITKDHEIITNSSHGETGYKLSFSFEPETSIVTEMYISN